jgi:RNA polymerase sigma-70 factor (ECF subfamily)
MNKPDRPQGEKTYQDNDHYTNLFEQYAARIFTYFQYRCNDSATAQDLTMQVFERLMGSFSRYEEDRAPVSAWLFSIARHVATDWQRQQYLRKFIPWDDFRGKPSGNPGPEEAALESEERIRLRQALRQLSNRERDVIGLRFTSGLTNRAITEITGLSESNVAVILFRALQKLRQSLSDAPEIACPNATPLREVNHE